MFFLRFDFDEYLRFDSLVEIEVFFGIEGNEDSNWIEDFFCVSSGVVFSLVVIEFCVIFRYINVWFEVIFLEFVEMFLNLVG